MVGKNTQSMEIRGETVSVATFRGEDYISLTDMAKSAGAERALHSWLRTRNTILFLGLWEQSHNPEFKLHEFVVIKSRAGENSFNPSITEWVTSTGAIGIISKRGRYGGTYAHKDIAFEFGTWLSPGFKLLLITEFQRLKERTHKVAEWDARRYISKVNYRLHTDSIKEHLIPSLRSGSLAKFVYTNEADMLNRLVFGYTAAEWRKLSEESPDRGKNQRDTASTEQLILLANLESLNSHLIATGVSQQKRLRTLADEAIRQYTLLIESKALPQKSDDAPTP